MRETDTSPVDEPVLDISGLTVEIASAGQVGKALSDISLHVAKGECLGLVGESGSGKSLTALAVVGLLPKKVARIVRGDVRVDGDSAYAEDGHYKDGLRGGKVAMILQDPMSALNPVLKIGDQVEEAIRGRADMSAVQRRDRAIEMLDLLKINRPAERVGWYPHQFSGGMRQRVVSAAALACEPRLLIADEPTTALDVTVEASFSRLLKQLQRDLDLSVLYISHDFSVVAKMCDRVSVMYGGTIVETGRTEDVLHAPVHPYTDGLIRSIPDVTRKVEWLEPIDGQPPSIFDAPAGCPFAPRCAHASLQCQTDRPPIAETPDGRHYRCWHPLTQNAREAADA